MAFAVPGSGSDSRSAESFVKRAAALRGKYHVAHCTGARELAIAPDAVAAHPAHRNSVRMNGQRCEELFLQVFRKFDDVEACHGAVCIDKRDDLEGSALCHALEIDDPHYARLPMHTLRYASLGSSDINQVLRNVNRRSGGTRLWRRNGRFRAAELGSHRPARLCAGGGMPPRTAVGGALCEAGARAPRWRALHPGCFERSGACGNACPRDADT